MLKQKQRIPVSGLSKPVIALTCLLVFGATLVAQVFSSPEHTQAATNETINFQARLLTASGSVVQDGYYNVEFKLYDVASAGSALWTETRTTTNRARVVNGYLTVNLGSVTAFPANVAWDQELWMTMNVGGLTETPDWDGEMSPRLKLTSVPFAKRASELAGGTGANRTVLDVGTPSGDNLLHLPAESGTLCVQNSSQCGFMATASGVQLQAASPGVQQTGHFNVSGTGIVGTALQTPIVDSAGSLSLGTTSATSVSLGHSSINTTITGSNVYLAGNTSVTSGNTFSVQSGWASITGLNTANPNPTLTINNHSSGASPLVVQSGGTTVFTVANGGAATFKNSVDSINALSVQNASGVALLNVDSSNGRVGVGGTASFSKFEVIGGDAAVYNNGSNPRLVLGDSTSAGENGYLQWDSTNNYFRIESVGTNGLKVNDNYVAIGNIFPDQPLIVGNGSTLLFRVNTTGDVLAKTSTNSTTAFQVQNASGTSLLTVDTSTPQVNLNTTTTIQGASAGSLTALTVTTGATNNKGLVVRGVASQSENLIDAQNSSSVTLFKVKADGATVVGQDAGGTAALQINNGSFSGASVGLLVQGHASQTGDMFRLQDASANTLFKVDADGDATIARTLDIQYQSGATNQLTIQGPASTFVTVNANQNKFFIGGNDSQCTGRFCVYQNTTGTGGSSYINTYNASLLNVSTASFVISQDVVLTDTSAAGVSNTLRGIRINSTGTTNTDATIYSLQIQLPSTTSSSVYAGNAIQVQNGSTNIFRVTNVGQTLFQTTSSFAAAFVVQNASSNAILTVDTTSNNQVILGKASTLSGKMLFQNATNANTVTIQSGATSGSYALTLPTALGASGSCLKDTTGAGVLGFGTCASDLQTAYDASTSPEITLNSTNGALTIHDASSSVGTLLEVLNNAGSTTYFRADTAGIFITGSVNAGTGAHIGSSFRSAMQSGASTNSADTTFSSGQVSGATSNSGAVTLQSGASTTSGNTGSVTISSGNATSGSSGNVVIDSGNAVGGTKGTVTLGSTNAPTVNIGTAASSINFGNTSGASNLTAATFVTANDVQGSIILMNTTADATHIQYSISKRSNNLDLWHYAYDGTTFWNYMQTDWANKELAFNATAVFQNVANSASAFDVQNAGGESMLKVDTTNGFVVIGDDSSLAGARAKLLFGDTCGNDIDCVSIFEGPHLGDTVFNDSDTMQIQGAGGIRFSTDYSMISGMVINSSGNVGVGTEAPSERLTVVGNFNVQNAGTLSKQYRFRTTGTALDFEAGGADMYISGWTGADYTGTQHTWIRGNLSLPGVFIGSGAGSASPMKLILSDKNTSGDPGGYNGAMYYNSSSGKFRCYEGGNWKNCLGFDANIIIFGANGNGAASQWSNMPTGTTLVELFGSDVPSPSSRVLFDLSNASQIRFQVNVAQAGATNAQLRIQYSTDQSTWNYLDSANTGLGQGINTTGLKSSSWSTIATGAKADVYLRVVGLSGDGVTDPRFGLIQVQAR